MKTIIIILLSLLMASCPALQIKKQVIPATPTAAEPTDKSVNIKIKVKTNEQSLENVVTDLNGIYGLPRVEISAFRTETGEIIVMKKLYYGVDERVFVIVSIVNDRVLLIDTVHSPVVLRGDK